ncbi:hypothetical protein BCV72DRAFT_205028, partial [Rhizopus microsporus var. microsporus]
QLIEDRGTGVGSRIKGHCRYRGRWFDIMCGKRGNVCITSEYKMFQTCVYCFEQLKHSQFVEEKNGKIIKRLTKGSLMYINPECVSRSAKSRDTFSSLAIGLSGRTSCVLGVPIPHFSPNQISQYEIEKYKTRASALPRIRED